MLITSVAISCCRVIAGSTSVCLRMLGVAEDSDSDERRRDSARLQPPQIYICFFRAMYVSSRVKVAHARERSAGRCFGATCFKFLGPF